MITLRPYQLQAHEAVRETWQTDPGALLVMATGTGKTITALSFCVQDFLNQGKRVVWLAHRQELIDQPLADLHKLWPGVRGGVVQANRHAPDAPIVFASVATLARSPQRAAEILAHGAPALVVVDEAHHATSPSHLAAIEALGAPLRLGLTATPHRDDGGDLSDQWSIAFAYGIAEAIRDGFLLRPYTVVDRVPDLHLEEVSGRWDYDDAALGVELLRAGVVDHTVATMDKIHTLSPLPEESVDEHGGQTIEGTARGRSCLVFTATIEQARLTAEALCEAGWVARHVSGETPRADRRRLLAAFKRGQIDALCNAAVLTEGTDLPNASVVVLARPTRSWSLYVQMVGRGLRLDGVNDEALILDLAGASKDHSLISAPVLIGGTKCKYSANGEHNFVRTDNGGARCTHTRTVDGKEAQCGKRLACFDLMGAHDYKDSVVHGVEGPRCTGCGRPRCVESPTLDHAWIAKAGFMRQCLYCGVEIYDPLSSMASERKKRDANAVEGDWVRLSDVSPQCVAVDVDEFGILFVRFADRDGPFEPLWLPKRKRTARPLSDRPVSKEYVRAYADDLVSRAAKVAAVDAKWKERRRPRRYDEDRGSRYGIVWKGESAGDFSKRVFRVYARDRAIKCGIVEASASGG